MVLRKMVASRTKQLLKWGLISLLVMIPSACGPDEGRTQPNPSADKDFVDRFNVVAKDIRDFPKSKKTVEQYFNIWTTVSTWKDAKVIMFGEIHDTAANQIWSAGALNKIIREGDVILFEGGESGTPVKDVNFMIVVSIFLAREYENTKIHYKPESLAKIWKKYQNLYERNHQSLQPHILNLNKAKGYFWDTKGDLVARNTALVNTVKKFQTDQNRVFVIAGALHTPHYAFAHALHSEKIRAAFSAYPGALIHEINDAFFDYFQALSGDEKEYASTRVIFDYLNTQDFAVMIPKNIIDCSYKGTFCPKNVR